MNKEKENKLTKYRDRIKFSLNELADFIAEYNKDGKFDKTAWNFWKWLDKKTKK